MFLEFQVRVINILTFQKTVLCPGDRQRVAARSVHKGTPFYCHCRPFYFALFRALSLAGGSWFTFAASLLSCGAIGQMDECAPAGHQQSPLDQCTKGLPFVAAADISTSIRSQVLSLVGDPWFMLMHETTRPCHGMKSFFHHTLQLRR